MRLQTNLLLPGTIILLVQKDAVRDIFYSTKSNSQRGASQSGAYSVNGEEKPRPFVYIICLLHTHSAPYWSLLN